MPSAPQYGEDNDGVPYELNTLAEHWVSEYTKLNMLEIEELNYFVYRAYLRDAVIHNLSQTEKGIEYLKRCYNYENREEGYRKWRAMLGE